MLNKSQMVRGKDAPQSTKELQSRRRLTFDNSYSCGVKKSVPWGWQGTGVISAGTTERSAVGRSDIALEKYPKAQG